MMKGDRERERERERERGRKRDNGIVTGLDFVCVREREFSSNHRTPNFLCSFFAGVTGTTPGRCRE